jgi:hypothetical protein
VESSDEDVDTNWCAIKLNAPPKRKNPSRLKTPNKPTPIYVSTAKKSVLKFTEK